MFSNLATKVALKKAGIPTDVLSNIKLPSWGGGDNKKSTNSNDNAKWPTITLKSLPLAVQPWLTPKPPPVPVAKLPKIGELAPVDREGTLVLGGGRKTLVVFLRCVGCACKFYFPHIVYCKLLICVFVCCVVAQKQFLTLRALATRHASTLTCIAVSHSSGAATAKWVELLGGARNVNFLIDEERMLYAAWGLGLGDWSYVFNMTSTVAGFKEKGWLGQRVASSLRPSDMNMNGEGEGPLTEMGNKWQESGGWAVDGRGKVVWGGKAERSDEVLNLEEGVRALGIA
ncbi:hypothetical protein QBC38DRAFT_477627 [Podospora fimiseda]|uniref:Uncharacterized protein n=1 Tax=Podospora fimiseda TaxID=252190 RepID=A0AAN7H2U0_9PEZI|nr:hypothetical protein QBC38DRAFT_477627 [Podospora fimiseda]